MIFGESGQGKSTLFNIISGLEKELRYICIFLVILFSILEIIDIEKKFRHDRIILKSLNLNSFKICLIYITDLFISIIAIFIFSLLFFIFKDNMSTNILNILGVNINFNKFNYFIIIYILIYLLAPIGFIFDKKSILDIEKY